ncbi:phage tail tape measure protein [Roseburia inulinivorans]|jgi:TP901 family phage tail tape measure protein|uniref:Phage tail tape measure protein n=1 Tax=Roseburia inulinivorans TaxID=360807 RepID=A0A3R6DKD2_9FIRM|nr:phage tail tape measure protein [Roseburia inulinivorans]RHA87396.1 phage tail tape measure protein [Roseburia inulinivorans]
MGMDSVYKLSVVLGLTDNMTGNLSSVTNKVADSTEKLNKAFGSVQKAGAVMVGVGTALTTACLGTVQSTFDTQNALGELASLGVQDLDAVEKAAKSFSDTWAGTTKSEFITASYDIKSGIASLTDEGVAKFTELAALTGKATKSTTEEMGSLFATGYGIYKGAYEDMSDLEFGEMFSAGIATAVKNYKTAGSEMASAISMLGATATNNKISMEEQLAILGQLQTTMSGSEAATKYKSFLNTAASAGEKLGLSFVDANNQLLTTPEILQKLKDKYGDTLDAVEKQEIKSAFGTDEAVAMIDLLYNDIDGLTGGIDSLASSMKQGVSVTNEMAEAIDNTPERKFEVLRQKIHNNAEELGKNLLPVVNNTLTKVNDLIDKGSDLIANNQQTVQSIMNIALRLGIMLVVIGTVVGAIGTIGKAVSGVSAAIKTARLVWLAFNAVFAATPIGWIVIAIVGLIAAFVLLWNKSEAFRNFWIGLFDQIKGSVTQAWETLQPALQNVGQKFMELYEAAKPILEIIALIAGVVGTFFVAQFVAGIQGMIAALTPLTNALSDLISFATNIINMFVALFTGDFTGACEFADAALQDLENFFGNCFDAILAFAGGFAEGFLGVICGALQAVGIDISVEQLKQKFMDGLTGILSMVNDKMNSVKDKFNEKMDAIQEKVNNAIEKIKSLFGIDFPTPKIKLPHIKIDGSFSLSPPSVPKISTDWYADGGIMTKPTIFGASGNTLLGGGEAGAEAILPLSALWSHLKTFIHEELGGSDESKAESRNIVSELTRRETRTLEKNERVINEKQTDHEKTDSGSSIIIQHLELKPDLTKIKDIELLQKLINELKDAQNSGDDPKPATT